MKSSIDEAWEWGPQGKMMVSCEDCQAKFACTKLQVAKDLLKEAVSGSKFAVEAVEQSQTAHITFQKVVPLTCIFTYSMPVCCSICRVAATAYECWFYA